MIISPPSQNEISLIVDLLKRQFEEHQIEISIFQLTAPVDAMQADPRLGFFILARLGTHVVGVACVSYCWTLEHGGKSAWLDELYVLPEYRSQGFGSALIDAVVQEAIAQGCAAIDLEVDIEHRQAEQLYQRYGFESLSRSRWVKELPKHIT